MYQINQMNMIPQYNQMNLMIQNNNINQMNNMILKNQLFQMIIDDPMNLYQIIQMYPILTNEKKEILSQLYQLYQNVNRINQLFGVSHFAEYSYNKEPKKYIYFIRNEDGKRFGIKIPYSLKSDELYQFAEKYKLYIYSDLKLFYKNNYLKEDIPIGLIPDGSEINIFEEFHDIDIDFTYYKTYLSKNVNKEMNNIYFKLENGHSLSMSFTLETTVKEMIKMFFSENRIPEKEKNKFHFIFNTFTLDINDNSTLESKGINHPATITVNIINEMINMNCKGKKMEVVIYHKKKFIMKLKVGTLNKIKELCNYLEDILTEFRDMKIQKLEIEGQELERDDERTFLSIGIRKNFICNLDLIKKTE